MPWNRCVPPQTRYLLSRSPMVAMSGPLRHVSPTTTTHNGFFPARSFAGAISQAGRLPFLCRPLASLNCVFCKNTFRGLGPGRKRADRRHEAWLSCSGGRVARNIPTAQPTRLPLQLFQFFVYLGERFDGEFQVFARMRGGDLRTHTRGANWNNRIEESDHVNAFL